MISKLQIHEFRKFKDVPIYMGKNITVIAGHNATGKSTILALLGHCAELGTDTATPFGSAQFRTEYSQIIHVDAEKDTKSEKLMSFTIMDPSWQQIEEEFYYRATIQSGDRYRILPARTVNGKKVAAKMEWPVIYLGLSRLYPLGESRKLSIHDDERLTKDVMNDMLQHYRSILDQEESITDAKSIDTDVTSYSKTSSFGVSTERYNVAANSAGQSNLGQILLAVESFRYLKKYIGENWKGGMLLIDELDATLHPSAQVKLFQYLLESSKELGIQVCFTTHSLYLLEYTIKKAERSGKEGSINGEIEVNYLAPEGDYVKASRNPSYDEMKYDLMMLLPPENIGVKIKAYVEDDEAYAFASALLRKYDERIEILSVELGCDNLIKLFEKDDNFRNSIIILDGDAKEKVKGINISLRAAAQKTIIALPADKLSPERVLYRFLFMEEGVDFTPLLHPDVGLTMRNIRQTYQRVDQTIMSDRDKAKAWFKQIYKEQPTFVTELMDYYAEKHSKECKEFVKSFKAAFNYLAAPRRIPKVR